MKLGEKKGQMEMVGLVIIVILITLGMLFMAKFALKDAKEKKVSLKREGLPDSTLGALLKTSIVETGCPPDSVGGGFPQLGEDLLEDCAENLDTVPDGYSQYRCNGQHSCVFLRERMQQLLESTLSVWGVHYDLGVQLLRSPQPIPLFDPPLRSGNGCLREKDSSSAFPITTEAGTVESVLAVCD